MSYELNDLKAAVAHFAEGKTRVDTEIPGLSLHWRDKKTDPTLSMYEPCICIVAQGAKKAIVGTETFPYDEQHYLITAMHMPTVVQVAEASREKPYLGLVLRFDRRMLAQVMADSNLPTPRATPAGKGMTTGMLTSELVDAFTRLANLLYEPESIPLIAPLIHKEIIYRLMLGASGERLRHVALIGSHSNQIASAVEWLNDHYSEPLKLNELAEHAGMAISTFHNHFKEMTALSPLQYQKRLRLQRARQLMLIDRLDVATAAFHVGYESSTQFSREYSRQFGTPPARDIQNMRQSTMQAST